MTDVVTQNYEILLDLVVGGAKTSPICAEILQRRLQEYINYELKEEVRFLMRYHGLNWDGATWKFLPIDYSWFEGKMPLLREQLESDCVEMMRYWIGEKDNRKNYREFCRYACLQIEGMLNFWAKQNNFTFFDRNKQVKPKPDLFDLIQKAKNEFILSRENEEILNNLRNIRNFQSHRNGSVILYEDQTLQAFHKIISDGFRPLKREIIDGLSPQERNTYYKNNEIYNYGKALLFLDSCQWTSVLDELNFIKGCISK